MLPASAALIVSALHFSVPLETPGLAIRGKPVRRGSHSLDGCLNPPHPCAANHQIQPTADLPLTTPVGALFSEGPIEIAVQRPVLRILRPRHSGIPAQYIQGKTYLA